MKSRFGNFEALCVQILKAVNQPRLLIEKHSLKLMLCNHSHSILDLSSSIFSIIQIMLIYPEFWKMPITEQFGSPLLCILLLQVVYFRCALVHIVGNEFESHWQPFFLCGNIPYSRIGALGAVAPSNAFILGIIITEFRFWKFEQK